MYPIAALKLWTCNPIFDADGELEASALAPKFPKRVTLEVD
jgi:hypothetical protein